MEEESALIIPVTLPPNLEALRLQFDPMAPLFPTHISVIFPFAPIYEQWRIAPILKSLIGKHPRFVVTAMDIDAFTTPDNAIIYLRVSPTEPITHLMQKIHRRFAQYPPYGGKFHSIVPHITLARTPLDQGPHLLYLIRETYQNTEDVLTFPVDHVEWLHAQLDPPSNCQIVERFPLSPPT